MVASVVAKKEKKSYDAYPQSRSLALNGETAIEEGSRVAGQRHSASGCPHHFPNVLTVVPLSVRALEYSDLSSRPALDPCHGPPLMSLSVL